MSNETKKFKGTLQDCEVVTYPENAEPTEIYICKKDGGGCIVCINNGDDNYDIESDLANAHLIAAAPELLEALQLLLKHGFQMQHQRLAKAAIHKALNL